MRSSFSDIVSKYLVKVFFNVEDSNWSWWCKKQTLLIVLLIAQVLRESHIYYYRFEFLTCPTIPPMCSNKGDKSFYLSSICCFLSSLFFTKYDEVYVLCELQFWFRVALSCNRWIGHTIRYHIFDSFRNVTYCLQ